ncbi:MAG: hypothetical protein QOF77_1584 [Solirubrobacteraceae bacterium]|nr:hypothetical protein [Solirubrobacteraceae bacterium]
MASGRSPVLALASTVLRVGPLASGEWRVSIDGLPPSDYPSREEACSEAEAYLAGRGGGGEIVVEGPAGEASESGAGAGSE